MINEWLKSNNITDSKKAFMLTSWWKHQATARHKKNPLVVKPSQITVHKSTITKEVIEYIKANKEVDLINIFGIEVLKGNFLDNSKISDYLLTENERNIGVFHSLEHTTPIDLNYIGFSLDLTKLEGMSFNEYEIRFPKHSYEVVRGGLMLNNCMGSQCGSQYSRDLMKNKKEFEKSSNYIDAHIVKDNQLVGVFALEEVLRIHNGKEIARSLFVNNRNAGNYEMELQLQKIISNVFGITSFSYNCAEYNPNSKKDDKIYYMSKSSVNQPIITPSFYKSINSTEHFINWDMILDSKKAK